MANINFTQIQDIFNRYQQQINLALVALLSLYLIAYAAELTWRLLPTAEQGSATQTTFAPIASGNNGNNQVNLQKIKQLYLFGNPKLAPVKAAPVVTNAPETNLNLTLTGVVASSEDDLGAAIIENRGQQNTYGVGEKIEGTNVIVKQVFADRIIIQNGSRNETLMLDGVDFKQAQQAQPIRSSATAVLDKSTQRRKLPKQAIEAAAQLRQQPANFTDFIAISPSRVSGRLQGYRVSPGKNPALFKAAGLKTNDIITEINGLDLTDIQQSMEAMGALRQSQSLQLSVKRKDQFLTLYLDLPSTEQ